MSAEPRFSREALQIHCFLDIPRLRAGGHARLTGLWRACDRLGMDRPLPPATDLALPTVIDGSPGFRQLAARRRQGPGVYEAMLYTYGNTLGLAVILAPPGTGASHTATRTADVWTELDDAWDRACAPSPSGTPDPLLGAVRIHRALVEPAAGPPRTDDEVGRQLALCLSGTSAGAPETLSERVALGPGLSLWEAAPAQADPVGRDRRLLATAAATDEQEGLLDDWIWTDGGARLAPVTRYLLHASIVRHQYRVRRDADQRLDRERQELQQEADRLLDECHRLLGAGGGRTGRRTLARWEKLAGAAQKLQIADRRAAVRDGGLRTMARTVTIAADTMNDSLTEPGRPDPRPLAADVQCVERLSAVLQDDAAGIATTRELVSEAVRVTTQEATQHLQNHQQYVSLVQTSVIGGLLMALTAVQALGYELPVPASAQGPLIALLTALAVALPTVVLRRWRGGYGGRGGALFEVAGLAGTGAAACWLSSRLLDTGHTALWVAPGALLFGITGVWLSRRAFL
ncbi:CATRA conflict system CASPASE/TPR repeat-associated protein [Streptomyces sp. JHA26]|uniref:CATRA conflict system CASPASE/TPR repeat-associated protein n=1 Tax=Streptomyces sp. JHA26 TaxID=1917143 RepID=UPI00117D675D|nr:CATRA conflict system CASPASE/TPR repeat-associated protein [Streptomyces sp. JHA26]